MRTRHSVTGPLILIAVGVVFLLHTISPEFRVIDLFAHYWPYFLILWGVLQLFEIGVWAVRATPTAIGGIGGGGWLIVLLICLLGVSAFEVNRPGNWWHRVGFENGIEVFGDAHDYSLPPMQHATGTAPHIIIERFRGDAKITGVPGAGLTLSGHKTIRALDPADADRANRQTPVEIVDQGKTIVIRCHQDRGSNGRQLVTTDLEVTVPSGASVEVTGTRGEFEISSISGDLDVNSDRAAVRARDVKGSVHIDTGKSDEILCSNIGGNVSLRGHGTDVALTRIAGEVAVNGDYTGVVTLEDIAHPVRVESSRTKLAVQRISGKMKLARGSLDGRGLVGPVSVATRATDVTLDSFSDGLDVTVDKGDIDLRPGRLPLGKMVVRTNSGDIDLAVPQDAGFLLTANTERGSIDSDLGPGFAEQTHGQGSRLQGGSGTGPDLSLTTAHGNINLHRGGHIDEEKTPDVRKGSKAAEDDVAKADE